MREIAPDALAVKGFLSNSGDPETRVLLERALALDPSNGFAWGALARLGYHSGDYVGGALAGRRGVQLRDAPWLDPIRSTAEFQAWLEREAEDVAEQRRELEALGPWTVDAILRGASR